MNMHLPSEQLQALPDVDGQEARPWYRRLRWKGIGLAVAILAAVALGTWLLVQRAQAPGPTQPPSGPPAVSVVVPGKTLVQDVVRVTGTISARREMPVGIVGEGGAIVAIRAEAGDYVRAGQVLAEVDSAVQRAQLAQLQAAVDQARADARLAQSELERAQKLVDRGFISQADIDRRTATRDAQLARVRVAEAQVREMQERIARLSVRAPEAGLVLARAIEPGQVVSPGAGALFRVAAGGALELRAEVAEQDLAALAVGEAATVVPVGGRQGVTGRIWLLEPVVDPVRRLGVARIALPADPSLRVGGFATAEIVAAQVERPVLPQSAVLTDNEGSFVLVVDAENRVVRRPVTIAGVTRDGIGIRDGLDGSERVVLAAGAFLNPGETVTPVLTER
ncbi:MAG: efflux RND transporter periplasmic adaptor subunit [Sphingomonadaceae bacterium]